MGPGMMKGMGHDMGPGNDERHGSGNDARERRGLTFADPARIDALKAELAITAAQEPAWTKYAKAVQDAAATMKTARESVDPTR